MDKPNTKDINTSTLLRRLFKAVDLEKFIKGNANAISITPFHVYISELCRSTGQKPEQIIKRSSIERSYGHQLFNGTRKPSRDKVLQLAFGFGLGVEDTQKLLKLAQKSELYPKIKRDAAILYCRGNHMDVLETQDILQRLGLTLLGGEEKLG
jgi:hypothetical protein